MFLGKTKPSSEALDADAAGFPTRVRWTFPGGTSLEIRKAPPPVPSRALAADYREKP